MADSRRPQVGLADLDSDGDLDLFVANALDNQLLVGDGAGNFIEASSMLPTARSAATMTQDVAFGDFRADGLLDIVVANRDKASVLLHNERGVGGFARASFPPAQATAIASTAAGGNLGEAKALAFGDLDGDEVRDGGECARPDGACSMRVHRGSLSESLAETESLESHGTRCE